MIIGIKFRDVAVAMRNKLRRDALGHKKGEKFKFSTTLLPYPLFCLTHLVAVRGIQAGVFEADYKSVDDLLHRPILEDVDYVPLEWNGSMLDKQIFPTSYAVFTRILRHVLLVAGFPFLPRCYAFRVEALPRGSQDVTERRERLEALQKQPRPKPASSRAKALLESLRQRLYALMVADSRERYFAEAAKLRSRGLSTGHLRCSDPAALDINGLVELFAGHTLSDNGRPSKEFVFDDHAEERSEKAMNWLLSYVAKAWTKSTEQRSPGKSTCFVCQVSFERRGNLTRHAKKNHLQILSAPFQCPECDCLGLPPHTTRSLSGWRNHTETVHGELHAPNLTDEPSSDYAVAPGCAAAYDCFVCGDSIPASRTDAIKHYRPHTAAVSSERLFACSECVSSEVAGAKTTSYSGNEMLHHLAKTHGHPDVARCPLCVWYGSVRGISTHVRGHFRKDPVPCLLCDVKDALSFDGYNSWYSHRELVHGQGALFGLRPPKRTQDQPATAGTKRKVSRCHDAGLNIVFEGCSLEEVGRKRARLSPCSPYLDGESGLFTDETGGAIEDVKDDGSIDYANSEGPSIFSLATSPSLDTPRTQFSPIDISFEPALRYAGGFGEGADDDTILFPDLDQLLKEGSSPCHLAGPKDMQDGATLGLDLDLNLDMDYAHLVQLDEMDFAQPPHEEGLGQ
ncbi:hypothetical protein MKZ38_003590 [Zalerion maritima]|uniref:C2H2-type domain-containing protein n=1 Tax=Zalerion maritima TaxID=339359 RepID=A0AAD5WRP9_9PEZI|nr:hypothetical protein MKZ38_003590 [Zalerion maritima]